ncbi:MAG TPA: LamG-like jellyroll fold domain-containing protein [Patescibacteria group bacterium]|nr:LamG-like jellyroll fold domain-containing protein [Patescibacteria group bacterium]
MEAYNKHSLSPLDKGQSFFEVVVAMALISLVLIAIVSLAAVSIRASVFSRNQTEASRFTQQAIEWLQSERDANWTAFVGHTTSSIWCLDSLYWQKAGTCDSSSLISGTVFTRSASFTVNTNSTITAEVSTTWSDAQGKHTVPVTVVFSNNQTTFAAVPTSSPTSLPSPSPTATPIPAPIAYWKFNEGSGTTVSDSSGNGNTGSLINTPTWTTGISNGAINFNGTNQYVSVSDSGILNLTGDLSISLWINPSSSQTVNSDILRKESSGNGFGIEQTGSGLNYSFGWKNSSGFQCWSSNPFSLTAGAWQQLVIVKSGATRSVYINGSPQSAGTCTGSNASISSTSGVALQIAGWSSFPTRYFKGTLDDIHIFNYALSSAQVQYLYNNPGN